MTLMGVLSWLAFLGILIGLLFLSLIHLFMIPKDVMKRDTQRRPESENPADIAEELNQPESVTARDESDSSKEV